MRMKIETVNLESSIYEKVNKLAKNNNIDLRDLASAIIEHMLKNHPNEMLEILQNKNTKNFDTFLKEVK